MPGFTALRTKSNQLQGLRKFHNAAVKCFTHMEEYIEHWCELLQLHQTEHNKEKGASFVIDSQQNSQNEDLSETYGCDPCEGGGDSGRSYLY